MRLADVVSSSSFFQHRLAVTTVPERRSLFAERCRGRSVLHVGCCDVPVFDPDTNLHLWLASFTDRLDGLDVSEEGLEVLRRHVSGAYFRSPTEVTREYDLLLAPEVIEHTPNPHEFLCGIFSVRATQVLITAPHIRWYEKTRREPGFFHEEVHPDHRAWYSPYTLLQAVRPFIDAERDDVELFLLESTGSVAIAVTRPFTPAPFEGRLGSARGADAGSVDVALATARAAEGAGDPAAALAAIEAARAKLADARLLHEELRLLLAAGRNLDVLRRGVSWLREHPGDARCLTLCADAAEAVGDAATAARWRAEAARSG